ncbi:Dbl homology domain-containing protein [Jimgerdemannia flammicorona]|uniref:Dbl homology domain-containing protein n=1 Tax=Jimgerdemannia flammicorona TaxID=994334 RepID=A0A433B995_9FUNG|nr:Dbl homology domain-containing protein [Jimgerdemannia flammicorona]
MNTILTYSFYCLLFAKPLRTAPCIDVQRRETFCADVFYNYLEVRKVNSDMMKELRDRQHEKVFVDRIGDIVLKHVKNFNDPYIKYGPHFVISEYYVKTEDAKNPLFSNFIKDREKQSETRRLPLRHFLIFPITRLQRYSLLLDAILKHTPEGHPDVETLTESIKHLRGIAGGVDERTKPNTQKVRLWQIAEKISFRPGENDNLRLLDDQRVLIYEGESKRRRETGLEVMDLRVFLFDNYLVMTKPRKEKNVDVQYVVSKKPIPLDLLRVEKNPTAGGGTFTTPGTPAVISGVSANQVPFTISYLGKKGGSYILYVSSAQERKTWKDKIEEAKALLDTQRQDVFQVRTLSDSTFPGGPGTATLSFPLVACTFGFLYFHVVKAVEVQLATFSDNLMDIVVRSDNKRMVAVGTDTGVWVGVEGDTTSFTQQLQLSHVTQMAVLEEQHMFVVLADKTLYAYALDAAFPPANTRAPDRTPQKLAQHVSYFNVGVCNNRTLVVSMRKRNTESHFKAMEPICGDLRNPKNKFTATRGMFAKTLDWFKTYKFCDRCSALKI